MFGMIFIFSSLNQRKKNKKYLPMVSRSCVWNEVYFLVIKNIYVRLINVK